MDVSRLRALVAVVDENGFTIAAERLGVTQSTVSRAVAALERDLGVPLLVRVPRGTHTLTEVGVRVVEQARQILDRVELIDAIAHTEREQAGGDLRVATLPSVGPLLAPVVAAFGREHPGIRVTLLEGRDHELSQWLTTGFADVMTTAENVDTAQGARPAHPLAIDRWMCALAADHPLAGQAAVPVTDLDDDTFLLSDGGCEPLVRALYADAGADVRVDHRIADMATLLTLVREGVGVTVVPELSLAGFAGIVAVPVATRLARSVHLTPAAGTRLRLPVARFLQFATQLAARTDRPSSLGRESRAAASELLPGVALGYMDGSRR